MNVQVRDAKGPDQRADQDLSLWRCQMLKPRARICSRPSGVIFSGPHGGIHTQLMRKPSTMPSRADADWSSMTSVSGHAADVRVMSMIAVFVWSMTTP